MVIFLGLRGTKAAALPLESFLTNVASAERILDAVART
jgi:hypothetical protein